MKRINLKVFCLIFAALLCVFLTACASNVIENNMEIIYPNEPITEEMDLDERITLNLYSYTLKCGEFFHLSASVFSDREMTVSYESSDAAVCTVSNGGRVVALSEGSATITVKGDGISAECMVVVVNGDEPIPTPTPTETPSFTETPTPTDTPVDVVKPERIYIDYSSTKLYMNIGTTRTLTAKVYPEEASQEVYWILSNTRVGTLDKHTGVLKATYAPNTFGAGYATITAMSADGSVVSEPLDLVVIQRVNKITVNTKDTTLDVGQTLKLSYSYSPNNSYQPGAEFESSDTSVATVSNGTVKAVSPGTAVITVRYDYNGDVYDTVTITVAGKAPQPTPTPTPEPEETPTPEVPPSPDEPPTDDITPEPEETPTPEVPPNPGEPPTEDITPEPEETPTPEVPPEPEQGDDSNGSDV